MKKVRISSVVVDHFKGAKKGNFRFEGANATISGRNGVGKTTLADAITYALTGKLTNGKRASEQIKRYEAGLPVVEGTNSVTVGVLIDDNKSANIIERESCNVQGVGNKTLFFIDGKQYNAAKGKSVISEMFGGLSEQQILLLMLPSMFSSLNWTERRSILLGLIKPLRFEEVVKAETSLERLRELMEVGALNNEGELEGVVKAIRTSKKNAQVRLGETLAVIDELQRFVVNKLESEVSQETAYAMIVETFKRGEKITERFKELKEEYQKLGKQVTPEEVERVKEIAAEVEKLKVERDEWLTGKYRDELWDWVMKYIDAFHYDFNVFIKNRIRVLREEENEAAATLAKSEETLYLIDKYLAKRTELQEKAINGLFKEVKFKLYDRQVNGEMVPTCDIVYNEVPHDEGLNKASRLKAELDIIKGLQKAWGVEMPVLIDEAESYNEVPKMTSQVIKFEVSEGDLEVKIDEA